MPCVCVTSDSHNPYINLAAERLLVDTSSSKCSIVMLWQNAHSIVVGRNQDINHECAVNEFLHSGGKLARRLSGGGAVYHDLGNLNFSVISQVDEMADNFVYDIIINILDSYGINAKYNGKNDILVDNRKISGNAKYEKSDIVCRHGTLLVDSNIEMMRKFLTPSSKKLESNKVKSIESRVINLCEIVKEITIENLIFAIADAFEANVLDLHEIIDPIKINKLANMFSQHKWLFEGVIDETSFTF